MMTIKKIRDVFYKIRRGIENTIDWIPVIWQDEDFDGYYLHKIMLHKLKKMEEFFRSGYAWGADSIKNADDLKYAINLLERMTNDIYLEEALKPFYEKYPDYKFKFETEPCEDNPKLHRFVDRDTEEQKELKRKCYQQEGILMNKDYDEFYTFLRDHIQEWWD